MLSLKNNSKYLLMSIIIIFIFSSLSFASTSNETLTAAITTNPVSLDAHLSTNTVVRQMSSYMYETLFAYGEEYEIIPQLVKDYDIKDDYKVWDIEIRKNVKFHNGNELTADDVKASILRYKEVGSDGNKYDIVNSIEIVDKYNLVITLSEASDLRRLMAQPTTILAIYPKEIIEEYGTNEIKGEDLIGTGPYKLKEWRPDTHILFERFEEYIPDNRFEDKSGFGGKRIANFKTIKFVPAPETSSRISGLETGEFDYAEAISITDFDMLEKNDSITPLIAKPRWGIVLELNQGEPPMDDVNFRRALVAALDMDSVMDTVTFGNENFYRTQPSIFFPEQTNWYSEAGSDLYNDPNENLVNELLEKADYNNETITLLSNRDFDWMYKATLSVASQWQSHGINVNIEFLDWPSQIQKALSLEGWHINQTGWSPRLDPIQLNSYLHSESKGSYNYSNEQMDKYLDSLSTSLELEKRQEIWEKVQELVWDDVAIIRIGDFHEAEAISNEVLDYEPWYVIPRFWNVSKK